MTDRLREALAYAEGAVSRLPHNGRCVWQSRSSDCDCSKEDALEALRRARAALDEPEPEAEPNILPPGTVCACLNETAEREVSRLEVERGYPYDRCQRCGALMEAE